MLCRTKRLRGSQSASAIAAALEEEEEEEEDDDSSDEDDDDEEESENPRWQLYQSIRNTGNESNLSCSLWFWFQYLIMSFLWNTGLSQPFWKLPSKRYYPDYYKEIATPMSLQQIRNKLLVSVVGRECIIHIQPQFHFLYLFFLFSEWKLWNSQWCCWRLKSNVWKCQVL